ncbi:hypothetical protein D1BOALGB6SA_5558 [Olavius sp. associated proteobacterium Delta 1]|nr:hypothetical protein D1BOALGB6SA_5558 [Olavius sp. associated proteobacterium Delta 1]
MQIEYLLMPLRSVIFNIDPRTLNFQSLQDSKNISILRPGQAI